MTQIALPATEPLEQFLAALRRLKTEGERVILEENGQPVAALVSMEDLRLFQKLFEEEEDRIDNAAADAALAEMEATGEKPVPLDQVLREIGREDLIRKD